MAEASDDFLTAFLAAGLSVWPLPLADFTGWIEVPGRGEYRLATLALKVLAHAHGMAPGRKAISAAMERRSSAFQAAFLRGFFDADGSVEGSQEKGASVRLSQSDLARLEAVQRMLLRLGIASTLYRNRRAEGESILPDGKGGMKAYAAAAARRNCAPTARSRRRH